MAELRAIRLQKIKKSSGPKSRFAEARVIAEKLFLLREELKTADRDRIRELWRRFIDRAILFWEDKSQGEKHKHFALDHVEIKLGVNFDEDSLAPRSDCKRGRNFALGLVGFCWKSRFQFFVGTLQMRNPSKRMSSMEENAILPLSSGVSLLNSFFEKRLFSF